ncbi:MAG: serine--tRNA ligase [Candidatus Aenigmarchaeota archaeon]|nr:serine--tRNA ligase [Candidatus Aenigmarchaeota archaeon]
MFDIKIIRENPDLVKKDLVKRNDTEKIKWVDETIKLDKSWRSSIQELNELRRRRNNITQEIAKLKKWGENAEKILKEAEDIPQKIKNLEEKTQEYQEKMDYYLMRLPNILHESVPLGKDDSENAEIRRVGKTPKFDFEPKNHLDLMQNLNLIEVDRAAKVSGHGFFYLKNDLARLDLAIVQYAIDLMMKRGYTFVIPPYMIHKEPFIGVTDFEFFEEQIYKIEKEDLYLIATAEHPLGAIFKDEILNKDDMPFKFCGFSPCFRKEVGAHGKYTKGLFRMHHFHKIEQFIFCHPDDSWGLHEELQKNSEDLLKGLGLTYRVVNVCTGDIGSIAAKKYDTEIWMADGSFREVGSNSNCTDYQARRLNIRFKEKEGQAAMGFAHTLNNTALATSRVMIGIIEQNQQKDGSINIPEALRPFMSGKKKIEKS